LPTRAEKVIWLFFAATSCQLAFLHPYIIMVPGKRANLFSGLLCLLTLLVALIFAGRRAIKFKSPEFLVSVTLAVLGVASALSSVNPLPSLFRVAILLASGLGGFWCARILLSTPENQRRFLGLCLFLLSGVLVLGLGGYLVGGEIHYYFFRGSNHPLTNLIFLLSFAPLALLGQKSRPLKVSGAVLLGLSYVLLCLSERLSVVFIPMGLGVLGVLFGALRWKHLVAALLVIALTIGLFSQQILWFKLSKEYPSYRIENFFFSWSIAKQHPLLGIGLDTPRGGFLKDYQVKYPYTTKEQFAVDLANIETADNQILTFISSLGLPFTLIYCLAVLALLAQLIRLAYRPPPGSVFSPRVLLFPLGLALVHWQLYDGLLFAQNSWFFHILLGLIPVGATVPEVHGTAAGADLNPNYPAPACPEPGGK
jgi:O-antigen ligase